MKKVMVCPMGHGVQTGKFCPVCEAMGRKNDTRSRRQRGVELIPATIYPDGEALVLKGPVDCPDCKFRLAHSHEMKCPSCGREIDWKCCLTHHKKP